MQIRAIFGCKAGLNGQKRVLRRSPEFRLGPSPDIRPRQPKKQKKSENGGCENQKFGVDALLHSGGAGLGEFGNNSLHVILRFGKWRDASIALDQIGAGVVGGQSERQVATIFFEQIF